MTSPPASRRRSILRSVLPLLLLPNRLATRCRHVVVRLLKHAGCSRATSIFAAIFAVYASVRNNSRPSIWRPGGWCSLLAGGATVLLCVQWGTFLTVLLWNTCGYDSAGTVAVCPS